MCASGLCAQTDHDTEPRCLEACDAGSCSQGFKCQAGLCVPEKGRCAAPAQEACNSVDDDLDGKVDEGVCEADEPCQVDAACPEGELCAGGLCVEACNSTSECADDRAECVERTGRYGEPDGKRICNSPLDLCLSYVCTLPESSVQEFVTCVGTEPTTCDEAFACVPAELQ